VPASRGGVYIELIAVIEQLPADMRTVSTELPRRQWSAEMDFDYGFDLGERAWPWRLRQIEYFTLTTLLVA